MEGGLTKPLKLLGLRVVSWMRGPISEYLRDRITQYGSEREAVAVAASSFVVGVYGREIRATVYSWVFSNSITVK
jgi:hypothetical protein